MILLQIEPFQKNINKISKSLYLIYIYIYIYIVKGVYFQYKTSKTGKKLQNCIQLGMLFLFVESRFRYPFLSLLAHDSLTWESLFSSLVASAHSGLTPQMNAIMPVYLKNHSLTRRVIFGLLLKRVLSNFLETGLQHCKESDCQCSKNQTGLACFPVQPIQIHDG